MAKTAKEAVEQVEGHEKAEPYTVNERYAAWAGGRGDEGMAFIVAGAKHRVSDPIGETLYDLHIMEHLSAGYSVKARRAKEWGYRAAAEFVASRRHQGRVRGYRLDWSRQAARDGLCLAMWGHLRGTGLAVRAGQFGVGERTYQRVRDAVRDRASALQLEFEVTLGAANDLDIAGYKGGTA